MLASLGLAALSISSIQGSTLSESAFDRQLNHHPYFPFVLHQRLETRPPYIFLVVQTGKGDTNSVLVERYATGLDPILGLFERELAQPLGLKRRDDQPLVVAVLGSPGALVDYRNVAGVAEHFEGQGLYDPALNAAVLSEDPFHKVRNLAVQELSERHAFLHVCQQAWSAPGVDVSTRSWILEALDCELARRDPNAPDKPVAPQPQDLRRFLLDVQDERLRWAHCRTLQELCTLSAPENLAAFFQQQAGPERPPPMDLAAAERAFYRQSTLLLHFLLEGAGRRYRPGCLAFLKQVFAGHADWPSCAQSFQPASGPEIDGAFLAWAAKAQPAGQDRVEIDAAVVQRALERGAASMSTTNASAPAAALPAPEPPALPTVPELAIDLSQATDDERLAYALHMLGSGRAQAGLVVLEELARTTEDETLRERTQREQRRAAAWVELRDGFLRKQLANKAEIEFTYKGRKLKSRVLGFADGKLSLEKERAPSSLSPDQIDPFELAQQIEPNTGANDWVRLYPYVLQESPKAAKLLKDDGEAAALKADLREDYPARLRLGALMGRIDQLAMLELPAKASEARARIEQLAAWRRDADGLPLLEEKRLALKDHVRMLLTRELDGLEPAKLLQGKLTVRKNGTALLAYEFDEPRELEDFSSENYHPLVRSALGTAEASDVPFHVEEGQLVGNGQVWLRSLVDFSAPLSVRYSVMFAETENEVPRVTWGLGICADGPGHFLLAIGAHKLQCFDQDVKPEAVGPRNPIFTGITYKMELRHDGAQATLLCDDEPRCSLGVGTRQAGAYFLCTSTETPMHIERLEVEGHLTSDSLVRLKRSRIERELERF